MARPKTRVVVIYNRDFEGAQADPENRAREDIKETATDVVRVLASAGYEARALGITDDVGGAIEQLRALEPTVVFNLCESIEGDNRFEALMPMLLELEGVPYTGSGPLALSMALHKHKSKDVLRGQGVPTPRGMGVSSLPLPPEASELRFPLIVKPSREDASVGVSSASVVHDVVALEARVRHVLEQYRQPALVEEFIEGREIYVSLLGRHGDAPDIFPFFEIDFSGLPSDRPRIVSFEGKWVEDSVEFTGTRPVRCENLDPAVHARICEVVRRGFVAMELRDYARFDIRLTADGTPYVIDVNPNCDLSAGSGGYAKAARASGLTYEQLVLRILELALARRPHADTVPVTSRPKRDRGHHRSEPSSPAGPSAPRTASIGRVSTRGGLVRARASRGGA